MVIPFQQQPHVAQNWYFQPWTTVKNISWITKQSAHMKIKPLYVYLEVSHIPKLNVDRTYLRQKLVLTTGLQAEAS